MKKKVKKKKGIKKSVVFFGMVVILAIVLYNFVFNSKETVADDFDNYNVLDTLQSENVEISKYTVYGTHLNIEGTLEKTIDKNIVKSITLVLLDESGNEQANYNIDYSIDDNKINFSTAKKINEGIDLESIKVGQYIFVLKIVYNNTNVEAGSEKSPEYYSLKNSTTYGDLEYYTITKSGKNNKIDIGFDKHINDDSITINYMDISVVQTTLPNNIYDIVIDPGHGGNDSGAVKDDYYESNIVLDYSLKLKKSLESLGLKVKLTREKDLYTDAYGDEGRAVIPNIVKSKYVFSVHLNSSEIPMTTGGVEVYSPTNANLDFAQLLADNIVKMANTTYSPNSVDYVSDGVYVRNFTTSDIAESNADAKALGHAKYNISTATPYLFMIRETGGISTGAYIDGRNSKYDKNEYWNSNMGVEGYLLELGYMTCKSDLQNLLNNEEKYIEAITKSMKDYLGL